MAAYPTIDDVRVFGSMPDADVDALETMFPGIVARYAEAVSRMFDARLRKRYTVPFTEPYPIELVMSTARVVAWRLWLKRGFNPSGALDAELKGDKDEALEWLREAADGEKGLIELGATDGGSITTMPAPLAYSEQSPFVWQDGQRSGGRDEDDSGEGTFT